MMPWSAIIEKVRDATPSGWKRQCMLWYGMLGQRLMKLKYRRRTRCVYAKSTENGRLVLFITPEHGNLGDHAIALAEREFFQDYMPDKEVIEITYEHYLHDPKGIARTVRRDDILLTNGGGYLGTLWFRDEIMVRKLIREFPNNRIVILPQTIYFDPGVAGAKELSASRAVYRAHPDLHFCARERQTYDFVRKHAILRNAGNLHLIPDMAAYLDRSAPREKRSGVLLCFREDKESVVDKSVRQAIAAGLKKTGRHVKSVGTVLPRNIQASLRVPELEKKFKEFRSAELVVTDRLHGMLFAAITATPCAAIDNLSGKVRGCYLTIAHLPYVRMMERAEDAIPELNVLLRMARQSYCYRNAPLKPRYEHLSEIIAGTEKIVDNQA